MDGKGRENWENSVAECKKKGENCTDLGSEHLMWVLFGGISVGKMNEAMSTSFGKINREQ